MQNDEINKLLISLSLEQKFSLLTGANFWETTTLEDTDLPCIVMNDGPFGVRKPKVSIGAGFIEEVYTSTAFPTTSALASSFDTNLIHKMGETLSSECIDQGVDILLGPGLNIKRSPLCGRNFEYFSEDPFLSSKMAGSLVRGLQSKGIGATLKHYAANNQEKERYKTNAIVDKRALNEIYLKPFHDTIKESNPYAVMCSYNQVNGLHTSRNPMLLTDKLRTEVGYKGLIMSDWGAVVNLVDSINSGLNLEMPGSGNNLELFTKAYKSGALTMEQIDKIITPILALMIQKRDNPKPKIKCNYDENLLVAQEVAEASAVLLKNEESVLPLNNKQTIALIGNFAKKPRYQGSGSSKINPYKLVSVYDAFVENKVNFTYADGYNEHEVAVNNNLIKEAVEIAKTADVVIICAGLPEAYEVEGYDRKTLAMPPSHNELINAVTAVNPKVVVVLSTGSAVQMPWLDKVQGVLLMHLAGSASGGATHNLLFGKVNPSGKLSETYPLSISSGLPGESFITSPQNVPYLESIFVGYRYYDTFNERVLFPFGYGLSYTKFIITDYKINAEEDKYHVSFDIKNVGHLAGAEVVGVYVGRENSKLYAAKKELKAFTKVYLEPRERKTVTLTFTREDLKCFDPIKDQWVLENTYYNVYLGIDVQMAEHLFNIEITDGVNLDHLNEYRTNNPAYYVHNNFKPTLAEFTKLYGSDLPLVFANRKRPFTLENNISDTTDYWIGRKIFNVMLNMAAKMAGNDLVMQEMAKEGVKDIPFRTIPALTSGAVTNSQRDGILLVVNGKPIRGVLKYLKKKPKKT